eukprot:2361476-Rhodomonas_salina.1
MGVATACCTALVGLWVDISGSGAMAVGLRVVVTQPGEIADGLWEVVTESGDMAGYYEARPIKEAGREEIYAPPPPGCEHLRLDPDILAAPSNFLRYMQHTRGLAPRSLQREAEER